MTRFGYACVSRLTGLSTNHTCQLKSASPEKLRALIDWNLRDLRGILEHNLKHGWRLFRVGSSFVPFASHPVNQVRWWEEYADELAAVGAFLRAHDIRLMIHPGQYTILNSPDETVWHNAVAELDYSARLLDVMGMNREHKVLIHVGGVYGDKVASSRRFVDRVQQLPAHIRVRLSIEHDEHSYHLQDVLTIGQQADLPVVYDNLHHALNPSPRSLDELLPEVFSTWQPEDGVPEIHFSSQAVGARPGTHAEYADAVEFASVVEQCTRVGHFDLMLEAKGKDAALHQVLVGKIQMVDR